MVTKIKSLLGLRGSWRWACSMMDKGHVVYQRHGKAFAKYCLDLSHGKKLQITFAPNPYSADTRWKPAEVHLSDFTRCDWTIWSK